jgi:membrane-associated phospholipid phosphatase
VRVAAIADIESSRAGDASARTRDVIGDVPLLEPRRRGPADRYARLLHGRHPATVFISAAFLGYAVAVAFAVGMGLFLTKVLLSVGGVSRLDEHFVTWLVSHRSPPLTDASLVGSIIAGGVVIPTLVGVVAAALACLRKWRIAAFLIAAIGVEAATYRLTVAFIHRHRPPVHRLEQLPVNASYPSGHTAASIAVYAGLALLLTSRFRSRALAAVCWTIALLVPLYVAWARMYRGMHHPLDSVAGALLGTASLCVAIFAARAAGAATHERLLDLHGHDTPAREATRT